MTAAETEKAILQKRFEEERKDSEAKFEASVKAYDQKLLDAVREKAEAHDAEMKTLLAKHAEEIKAAARNAGEKAAGDADAKREKELQALMKKHADALDAAAKDAKGRCSRRSAPPRRRRPRRRRKPRRRSAPSSRRSSRSSSTRRARRRRIWTRGWKGF